MTEPGSPVLLYDGVCGFCDRAVRWVLRADSRGLFRFAPLEGDFAREVLAGNPHLQGIDSLVLVEPEGAVHVRSAAVLRTARLLGGPWRLLGVLGWLPRGLLDRLYDAFARRRYRLFGRFDACPVPPPEVRDRFLD